MSDRIFSITYMACLQNKFEEEIKSEYLEQALETLESFPNTTDPYHKLQKLIVMYEGYRAIAREYRARSEEDPKASPILDPILELLKYQ